MNQDLIRTARTTGALYLGMAVFGVFGFLVARASIFVEGDAAATTANLIDNEAVARLGLAADMSLVVVQVLTAFWFFRLFRDVSTFAAGSLAVFGLFNSVAILVGAAFTATAIGTATGDIPALAGDPAGTTQLMFELNEAAWGMGNLFFGLWLIPMGRLVVMSGYMPRILGHLLVIGGIAYVADAFVIYLWPEAPSALVEGLTLIPSAGEFWVIGYLLIFGVRRTALKA